MTRAWIFIRTTKGRWIPNPPKRFRRFILSLAILSILAGGADWLLVYLNLDRSDSSWSVSEIATEAGNRLKAIATTLDTARERLARDPAIHTAFASNNTGRLFSILYDREREFDSQLPDSTLYFYSVKGRQAANRGYAVYSGEGRLLAWNSPPAATFGLDSILSSPMLLPTRDRAVMLQNGPIYVSIISIRKTVSEDGRTEYYIAAKQQLASKEPIGSDPAANFLDDLAARAGHQVRMAFGGRAGTAISDTNWVRIDLLADPSDPTSYIGTLSIGRAQQAESSIEYEIVHEVWTIAFTLTLLSALLWFLIAIAEVPQELKPVRARMVYSLMALAALYLTRVLVAATGIFANLFDPQYQNTADFASRWSFGIVANPLELFITSVFASASAIMLWIIWMPRSRLVRDESLERHLEKRRKDNPFVLFLLAIASVLIWQLLVDGLSQTVEAIIADGSLRYLEVQQVLPSQSMLMMMLSFLGIGVTYLFVAVLVLTFGLRSAVLLTSGRLSLRKRIVVGSFLSMVVLGASVELFDNLAFSDTSMLIRSSFALLTFLVSISIIVIDSVIRRSTDEGPSFLYKLPRSSRSILFILAVSAMIMSPLIADKQLFGDERAAEHIVVENAEVSTPELQNVAEHLLDNARENLSEWQASGHDTSALHEKAFLIWFKGLREHPLWNASIDVYDANGTLESHFATLGASNEISRIRPSLDSELISLRRTDSSLPLIRMLPSFSLSGAPAIVGGIHLKDTMQGVKSAASNGRLFVTIALWSELPAFASTRPRISILPGTNPSTSDVSSPTLNPTENGGFIVAQYRPNMRRLTNSPALDVPIIVPPSMERQLQRSRTVWAATTIHDDQYRTLYYRASAQPSRGEPPTVVAVSIPEPTFSSTLEFALRLNAIGLLYGVLIVILLLIARQVAMRKMRFTLHFRDRIFLIVLVIALVPLVVVTNVTRNLLAERAHVEEQDRLARDAMVIRDRMTRTIEQAGSSLIAPNIQTEVNYMSDVIGRDFSLYDAAGRLKASSRPELYESSLLSSTLNARAVREVIYGQRSFFTGPVSIGSQIYNAGYQPVSSADGSKLLAVLSLATMDEEPRIEAEIARTTTFIYGTFAALGLILLGIGALFAARVASPIMELIRATQRVAQGKLTTRVPVTREDEIGDLMTAFNTMTHELERSREIVAQTERELAWKEMARQVAHEIKNPLTPMKLSVQHLEHAHDAKDPNFNPIFRRVIRTLREQIDVLTRIATEFAHFGAMPRRRWGAVDIRKVADSAVALFDAERSRIRFIIDVPKDLPRVHSDEEELRRAFVNLLRNAAQAIEGWGVIVIHARTDQGMVNIRVRDTGFGMSEETLKRVFDPNFSTKTSGMGLGLAIVKKTITDMSGTIRVESTPGHGTTFFIDLPARADLGEEE
jgi:signal transduction histidine kinase